MDCLIWLELIRERAEILIMINKKEDVVERKNHNSIYLINTKQNYLNDKY